MVKRLSEEEFVQRINYLWQQFHDRPEMQGTSYDDFKKECFEEFRKQSQMSDKELDFYRKNNCTVILKNIMLCQFADNISHITGNRPALFSSLQRCAIL